MSATPEDAFKFPSPVGGSPLALDFAPSILFAVLYGSLAPLVIYRVVSPKSRSLILLGPSLMAIGRVADFSVRVVQSRNETARASHSLVTYLQATYATTFITGGQALLGLLRCLFVLAAKTTSGGDYDIDLDSRRSLTAHGTVDTQYPTPASSSASIKARELQASSRVRLVRTVSHVVIMQYYAALALAAVAGGLYYKAITSSSEARLVQQLRYAATIIPLVFLQLVNLATMWAWKARSLIPRNQALYIALNTLLLSVVAVYRLVVMQYHTVALESTAPGSLNSPSSKATFYVFHLAPEFIHCVLMLSVNLRTMFSTGKWAMGE